jgi:hypothetical protein
VILPAEPDEVDRGAESPRLFGIPFQLGGWAFEIEPTQMMLRIIERFSAFKRGPES